MKQNNAKNKGITLIALVITIVILIILAGVTINTILGNDGLLNRTKTAADEYNKQEATECMNLKITNCQMSKYAEKQRMPTLKELAIELEKDNEIQYVNGSQTLASTQDIDFTTATSIFTKLKAYPYEFEINSSLQLASVDGVQVSNIPDNKNNNYSETEQVIGTWINGKPIYQKVFTGLSATLPVGKWCYGAINIPDIETPIYGSAIYGNNSIVGGFELQPNDNGNIDIRTYGDISRTIDTLIIQYTKKSDLRPILMKNKITNYVLNCC